MWLLSNSPGRIRKEVSLLFNDRYLAWKMLGALVALAFLFCLNGFRPIEIRPSILECIETGDRFAGNEVYVGAVRVVDISADSSELRIMERTTAVRILQPSIQARVGDRISVRGNYVPPDAIQARRATRHEGYVWKRTSMYVLSVGALLFLAYLLWQRYRLRRGLPLFVPRT